MRRRKHSIRELQAAMDTKRRYVPPPASKAWAIGRQLSHLQTDIALAGSRHGTSEKRVPARHLADPAMKRQSNISAERPKLGRTTDVRSDIATVP
jgi:hypothetical protein